MKRKPIAVLFSLAAAFILWLYVITVVSPEFTKTYYSVPVSLQSESMLTEQGLMLASTQTPTVRLVLEGNRSDLININNSDLTVVADLTGINEPGEHKLTYNVSTPSGVPITVQDKEPSTVTVNVVERETNQIPVQVEYTGTVPEGYIIDKGNELLDYESVSVSGPKDVVDKIDHAAIKINCDEQTQTIVETQRFVLCDAQGNPLDVSMITTDVEEIRLEVKISRVKTIPLVLTVNDGGGATEENSKIVIDPLEISVSGSETVLENLNELNIGTINLAEILDAETRTFEIKMPEGVKNESGITSATASISFPELSKKDFTITDIQTRNVAEGMEATLLTKQLTITVRGPKSQVASLTEEDISVVLDLADVVNTDAVVPQISFGADFPDVGVVGKYTVSVTVAVPVMTPEETPEG